MAAAGNVINNEGINWSTGFGFALSAVAWVPGVGDAVKGVGRGLMRLMDDVPLGALAPNPHGFTMPGQFSEWDNAAKTEATVFRQGTFADEALGWEGNYVKGRQWATDNPLTTPNYAQKYGLPAENTGKPDWIVGGRTQGPFTTRPAPGSHNNPLNTGGATEVLPQNPNDVRLGWFHMPD
jgi:hypothetical protein